MNKFSKYLEDNYQFIDTFKDLGFLNDSDIEIMKNENHDYTYDEQFNKIKEFVDLVKKNKDLTESEDKDVQAFVKQSIDLVNEKQELNEDDWMDYDQKQMEELAHSLEFDWWNKEDRRKMMQYLQDKTIKKERQKLYEEEKAASPKLTFLKEMLAPNTAYKLEQGEDVGVGDYLLDGLNTGLMVGLPGAGVATKVAGKVFPKTAGIIAKKIPSQLAKTQPALYGTIGETAADIGTSIATDINTDNLGAGTVLAPLVAGASVGSPQMLRGFLDAAKGYTEVGQGSGRVVDNYLDPIIDALSTGKEDYIRTFNKQIKDYNDVRDAFLENVLGYKPTMKERNWVQKKVLRMKPEKVRGDYKNITNQTIKKKIENDPKLSEKLYKLNKEQARKGANVYSLSDLDNKYEEAKKARLYRDHLTGALYKHKVSPRGYEDKNKMFDEISGALAELGYNPGSAKEIVQPFVQTLTKGYLTGYQEAVNREDRKEEKKSALNKQIEDIKKVKANAVKRFYTKGDTTGLTDEEIEILRLGGYDVR